jgi:hypothetical protein
VSDWNRPTGAGRFASSATATPTNSFGGITLSASSTPHTKGAWLEVFSSTPFDVLGLTLFLQYTFNNLGISGVLLDVGVGASGSEVVVIPDLQWSGVSQAVYRHPVRTPFLPVYIPAGSRIAVRAQSNKTSDIWQGAMMLHGQSWLSPVSFNRCKAYGIDSANSRGTNVNGGGNDTKGSWSEITSSTTYRTRGLILGWGGGGTDFASQYNEWKFDLAVGASGSETVVFPDIQYTAGGLVSGYGPAHVTTFSALFLCDIPAGTRLAVRFQAEVSATAGGYGVIHAFD